MEYSSDLCLSCVTDEEVQQHRRIEEEVERRGQQGDGSTVQVEGAKAFSDEAEGANAFPDEEEGGERQIISVDNKVRYVRFEQHLRIIIPPFRTLKPLRRIYPHLVSCYLT